MMGGVSVHNWNLDAEDNLLLRIARYGMPKLSATPLVNNQKIFAALLEFKCVTW